MGLEMYAYTPYPYVYTNFLLGSQFESLTSTANTMANGKDFFVELRKQVAVLQKSGPAIGG